MNKTNYLYLYTLIFLVLTYMWLGLKKDDEFVRTLHATQHGDFPYLANFMVPVCMALFVYSMFVLLKKQLNSKIGVLAVWAFTCASCNQPTAQQQNNNDAKGQLKQDTTAPSPNASANVVGAASSPSKKTYTGTINGKLKVVMQLNLTSATLTGFYFYESTGIDIPLSGRSTNGLWVLHELDHLGKNVAKLTVKLAGHELIGQWTNLASQKSYPIKLSESSATIRPLPKQLLGNYTFASNDCNLQLQVSKRNGAYFYELKSPERTLTGKVSFYRSLDDQPNYIKFHGITWAEEPSYNDGHENDKKLTEMIEGTLGDGEIVIQNTGNVMNSYTKLGDCGAKYIELTKTN